MDHKLHIVALEWPRLERSTLGSQATLANHYLCLSVALLVQNYKVFWANILCPGVYNICGYCLMNSLTMSTRSMAQLGETSN